MKCEWDKLLAVLPQSLRLQVDKLGKLDGQEIRLRLRDRPQLVFGRGEIQLEGLVTQEQLQFVMNTACRYSPWASETVAKGYLTAPGGHRIGICGEAVIREGAVTGIRNVQSLCIRIARDFPGIAGKAAENRGNLLILGPPGSGKTTLLRDLIRQISDKGPGSIGVVDESGELFPPAGGFFRGARTDVLTGCPKPRGIEMVLKTMGPATIALDEITSQEDCEALEQALWCGVRIIATAHARDRQDLMGRMIYRKLAESGLFDKVLILQQDKSWRTERM